MKKLLCKIGIHINTKSHYIGSSWSLGQFRCNCPNCGKSWIELRQIGKEKIEGIFGTMWIDVWMICLVLIAIILFARLF